MKKHITAEQYRKLISHGENLTEDHLYEILLGKSKLKLTMKEIEDISFDDFKMPVNAVWCDLIYHEGILYGRKLPDEFTFGEYLDLTEMAKNLELNLISLLTLLWRPVTKISYWNRTKAYLAYKFLVSKWPKSRKLGFKILSGIEYEIEEYDAIKCIKREDTFKSLPAEVASYTTTFFLITSQQLLIGSLRSLQENLDQTLSQLSSRVSSEKISADGDSTPTSGSLQENK